MKISFKRPLAIILAAILIFAVMPCGMAFADSTDGYFYLTAATESKMIIAPVRVGYEEGMSIRDALIKSAYEFEGIEGGFISSVEGYVASFSLFYDGGEYDLDIDASKITAIAFMEKADSYSQELISLICLMGEYSQMDNNIHNYSPAKEVYEKALDDIRSAESENVKRLYEDLKKAVEDYEKIITGKKHSVTFNVTNDPSAKLSLLLTDEYGNSFSADSNTINVVAGNYSFSAKDGGFNRVEGKVNVSGDTSLDVKFPEGDWFGDIRILDEDKAAYEYVQDRSSHTAKYFIPDTATETDFYLNAQMGATPDVKNTKIYAVYVRCDTGLDKSNSSMGWESTTSSLAGLMSSGMDGITIPLEARYATEEYTQIQSYTLEFVRIPTLSSLKVMEGNTQILKGFSPNVNEYSVTTLADKIDIEYKTFGKDYSVTIDGSTAKTIDLTGKDSHKAKVEVKYKDVVNTYTVNITKVSSAKVTVKADSGVTFEIFNSEGSLVTGDGNLYKLVSGEEYYYVATKNKFFHTSQTFTAKDAVTLSVKTPETTDALKDFVIYNASSSTTRKPYSLDSAFSAADHEYVSIITDMTSSVYAQATPKDGYEVTAEFISQSPDAKNNGKKRSLIIDDVVSAKGSTTYFTNCIAKAGYSQDVSIRATKVSGGVKYYQDYVLTIKRSLNLDSLSPADDSILFMNQTNTAKVSYDYQIRDYYIFVPVGTPEIAFKGAFPNEKDTTDCCGGYYAVIGGKEYDDISDFSVPLSNTVMKEDITIKVCHEDDRSVSGTYTIHVTQQEPVTVQFTTSPSDAIVYVKNNITGKRIHDTDGKFSLNPGSVYTYTVTRNGYVGKTDKKYTAPLSDKVENVTLAKAKDSTFKVLDSWWSSFRADKNNNGIIDGRTPVSENETVLYWATKIGSGFDKNACGCPIIVDGYLYTYAGTTLYKVDTVSGEILATGQMDHASSFAVNPPTYADGMIFIGLAEGCVQAFSAETLESLWLYRDELGGQPNCNIYYHDGYIYTGFWRGENVEANYVCLSVTDEEPAKLKEEKLPTWTYTSKGGFYWAGAFVNDNFAIIGTDDGESGCTTGKARIVTFSTKTGKVIDEITMPNVGDIRSTIVYDAESDEYYFTSKGGYFYGLKVEASGNIKDESLRYIRLTNGKDIKTSPPMSTSSPAVYNKRAYIGVSGTSQFGAYSGHNITVLDLKNWQIAYTVPTQGYPQTSGIVSTAYEEEDGCVYVYFIDNYTPGKLRVISDKPNQTKPSSLIVETYIKGGKPEESQVGEVIFTPDGVQSQYAICSPIVDEYGTIYFKNDSAYLMAVGSTIEQIRIRDLPEKTSYDEGDIFDGEGMVVEAVYSNGLTRDITEYVTYSTHPLTADDTNFEIRFEHVMYQNKDNQPGSIYTAPIAFVELDITPTGPLVSPGACDLDADGMVDSDDLSAALMNYLLSGKGDVNEDGIVDSRDISQILRNYGKSSATN